MLRLLIDVICDMGYIYLAGEEDYPADGLPEGRSFFVPEVELGPEPALDVIYGPDRRIIAVEIYLPSESLGERFQTLEDGGVFPVYMTVDYAKNTAHIAFRERQVEVTLDEGDESADIGVREKPGRPESMIERGPISIHYDADGRILAIRISGISEQLPGRFLSWKTDGR
jgi:hypothetical protein